MLRETVCAALIWVKLRLNAGRVEKFEFFEYL